MAESAPNTAPNTAPNVPQPVQLSAEQQAVATDIMNRRNVMLTGMAGTGKSELVRRAIKWAQQKHLGPVATASTGLAALNIGGCTIHSFLGTGIKSNWDEVKDLRDKDFVKSLRTRHQRCGMLIVDEISMITGDYLDMMDKWLRHTRQRANEPFGGLHIILCGDFLQLPPVIKERNVSRIYAFRADCWDEAKLRVHCLTKSFRQDNKELVENLQKLRTADPAGIPYFAQFVAKTPHPAALHLYPTNLQVDRRNADELAKIDGESFEYEGTAFGEADQVERLLKSCPVDARVTLKVGARVIICRNLPDPLNAVNGDVGKVVHLEKGAIRVLLDRGPTISLTRVSWEQLDGSGRVRATFTQYPVRLAYALTVHKSQGMSLDRVYVDPRKTFIDGQAYVALSRVKTPEGLQLASPITDDHIRSSKPCVRFYERAEEARMAAAVVAASQPPPKPDEDEEDDDDDDDNLPPSPPLQPKFRRPSQRPAPIPVVDEDEDADHEDDDD